MVMVAASTVVGLMMASRWGNSAVDLVYLPAVLGAAVLAGLWPAMVAAAASALAYNYFFTAPYHTFVIHSPADVVTVLVLFLVAVVASQLAASIRRQAQVAAAHAARNAAIAGFARRLLSCTGEPEIAEAAVRELSTLFGCNAVLVSGRRQPEVVAAAPARLRLTPSDIAAAALVLETGEPAGRGIARAAPAEWQFHSVRSQHAMLAAMGLARDDGARPVSAERLPLLTSLLDQIALAVERARLEADQREVDSLRERDRLRSALLSSVGHDLRTPLTAIIGATAELRRTRDCEATLVSTLSSEASKLERYITNLLDMARIEAGAVKLKAEPVDLVDSVAAALKDVRDSLGSRTVEVELPADLPLVRADPQLLHHCLINLLDNAARHSGEAAAVRVRGALADGDVLLSVEDHGPGLKLGDEVLDTFVGMRGSDRTGGAGLGLAIVKAFSEAVGAELTAANRSRGTGAVFTIRFPRHLTLTTVASDAE
jgi:two-component system, OmpR family, sensor histidine kinase KdpD